MKSGNSAKNKKVTLKKISPVKASPIEKSVVKKAAPKAPAKPAGKLPKNTVEPIHPFPIVAIGASAGGLEAMTLLLQNLSVTTGMAFIYVQHLSPDYKSILSSILGKLTKMKVQDIDEMEKMEPNNVYVIPYNKEIEVMDGHIKLLPRPTNKTSNLSIDVLFSSLAETHKENVVGIVLSGSASDGTRGLKEIKLAGGITFAQDDSAKFSSMPKSAIAEGVVDFILSPKEMAKELNWMGKHPLVKRNILKPASEEEIENSNPDLRTILQLIYKKKNVDFSHYKMNTIKRRMLRRMLIHKIKTLNQYADLLLQQKDELDLLYQDLLINVTEFFRDADAFAYLKKTVLPTLLKSKTTADTLRIWVSACASGEEAYSIAMLLIELQETKATKIPFQIFASDLSPAAISEARTGEFTMLQLKNVSPKRLQQFFTKAKDKYRISKALRDVCVFAEHNILSDPPFSRMDLISCRNLLIYLDATAQKKIIATFHYALNENGYLVLGKSETIGASAQLFTSSNKKFKTFTRKKNSGTYSIPVITPRFLQTILPEKNNSPVAVAKRKHTISNANLGAAFDTVLLSHFTPASVIINHAMEILEFRGPTELYLKHAAGKASFNILKMVNVEITFELRNAIHNAIKTKQIVRKTGIEMNSDKSDAGVKLVNLEVLPLKIEGEEPMLVIVFTSEQQVVQEAAGKGIKSNSVAKDRRIKKLEEELAAARADMGAITHDQEAANEELQSANEEIVSSNEELQSLNEELETSKEEIESTNEELTTSNHELQARIQQVEELYTYYEAILSTVQEPMLILDKDMRIKSANKSFCKMFKVTEDEIIGISLFRLNDHQWNIPRLRELLEDIVAKNIRFQDFEVEHDFTGLGKKVLLLNAHRIIQQTKHEELIVLTAVDITEVRRLAIEIQLKEKKELQEQLDLEKKAMKLVEDSNKRYSMMLMNSPFAFAILKGKKMVVSLANDSIKEIWGKGKDIEGKTMLEILPEIKGSQFPGIMDNVYKTGQPFHGYEVLAPLQRNGKLEDAYFNFVYQPYLEADETISGVTIISNEVTAHVIAKNELLEAKKNAELKTRIAENAVKAKQQFLSNMSHEIRTPMNSIIGFTNVVLKTKLSESQKEYINAIKVSGESLIVLINDILDLAKVDAGKMTFEAAPFYMFTSVSDMLHLFETKIQEKNLTLVKKYDTNIPELLVGDQLRLRQIILNLMSNAVKFTAAGKITVQIKMLSEEEKSVTIQFIIADTGIGMAEKDLEHIFDSFQQVALETNRLYGGTGLGLAIVKQLVELQGGSVKVKSKEGQGSTFSFTLSFQKSKTNKAQDSGLILPKGANKKLKTLATKTKVLVAEDIALNQLLVKIILEDFGFEIDIAANGKIAVEYLQKNKYDIILMDLQMPEMNGFEATDFIRKELKSDIPIIALTADVTTVDVDKCLALGMNDYISKPINEKLLYSKIMACLKVTK
jgi:two-component system CheB/CheR fusion protein